MNRKILAALLAIVMLLSAVAALAGCNGEDTVEAVETDPLLPAFAIEKFDVSEDFKIGVICLHDENSTYDNNFIKSIKRTQRERSFCTRDFV